jgi:hypothetical protein
MQTPDERLLKAASLFKERNGQYKANYLRFGPTLAVMFPDGVRVQGAEELGRFLLFAHLFTKLTRYATNMNSGGHEDSLDDLSVYAMMLAEHDERHRPVQPEEPESLGGCEWRTERPVGEAVVFRSGVDVERQLRDAGHELVMMPGGSLVLRRTAR